MLEVSQCQDTSFSPVPVPLVEGKVLKHSDLAIFRLYPNRKGFPAGSVFRLSNSVNNKFYVQIRYRGIRTQYCCIRK
jgi:hypothetical protein